MNTIISDLLGYMGHGPNALWYVGIASDPDHCLFTRHNVNKASGAWIYRDAGSSENARAIEKYFIALGTDGGPGGGDYSTRFVYAYKKTLVTVER